MTVQLCGKISGRPIDEAWAEFNKAENLLRAKYPDMVIINPLRLCDPITEAFKEVGYDPHYEHYMSLCLASLKHVYKLVTLPDADLSDGAKREMKRAWELGKEIVTLEGILG